MSTRKKRDPLLKAPFPYYGGKSRAASLVWEGLGDVDHYIEPCFGSGANMIARPHPPRVETVNDTDCYLTNFWRCIGPNGGNLAATLAELCNYPVSELDLHASHRWLVGVTKPIDPPADWAHGPAAWVDACTHFRGTPNAAAATFRERMRNDPDYRDPLYAARWVWGICQWIGGGWCQMRDQVGAVENPEADEDRSHCEGRPFLGGFEGQTGQGLHGSGGPGAVPNAERRPALSTGDGPGNPGFGVHAAAGAKVTYDIMPGHPEKGIHAAGETALDESRPLVDRGGGHGVHAAGREVTAEQLPMISMRPGSGGIHQPDATGLAANREQLPDFQICQTGGRGVHSVGESTGLPAGREKLTYIGTGGRGIHQDPADENRALSEGRPQLADAYDVGRGVHSGKAFGTMEGRLEFLRRWFLLLADRFRLVRVCCGDWRRVVGSESVTTRLGVCGIFLDPPYGLKAKRDNRLYGTDSTTVADEIRVWCLENQADPKMRIVLAGYEGEHDELSEKHGWRVVSWESKGYGSRTAAGRENQKRERLWFSPHCLKPRRKPVAQGLFD